MGEAPAMVVEAQPPVDAAQVARAEARLRVLVVGASTDAVCGVRDHARVLSDASDDVTELVWWERAPGWGPRRTWRELRRWIGAVRAARARHRSDVVLWHYSVFTYGWRGIPILVPFLAAALAGTGAPLVVLLHELAYPFGRRGWRGAVWAVTQRCALAIVMRVCAAAVVTTEGRHEWLRTRGWLPARPVTFVPVCSNLPPATTASQPPRRTARIGVLGYGAENLLVAEVVEAIARLRRRASDAELVLVGAPGPASSAAGRWADEAAVAGCGEALRCTGVLGSTDLAAAVAALDVVLVSDADGPTSRRTTLAAALAQGRPVVCVDGPGRWEDLVRDGAVALADRTPQAIASTLEHLLGDDEARSAQGARGADFYRRHMSPRRVASSIGQLLRSVADAPVRTTIVAHDIGPGGGMEAQTSHLVTGLLERGAHVTVVARTCALAPSRSLRWHRVRGPRRPFSLSYLWFLIAGTWLVSRVRRGVLHTTGAIVLNRADVSTVHFCHRATVARPGAVRASRRRPWYLLNAWVWTWMARAGEIWCYRPRRTGCLVGVSPGVASELRMCFPAMASRVTVVPNSVDGARFHPCRTSRAAVRGEMGIGDQALLALFVGGDWERKGLGIAIEGVASSQWHLAVVGAGDAGRYRRLAHRWGAPDRVHFLGWRPDAERYYAAADAFLLPSAYETFSLAAHEAAASGLPLVVTRVSGVEDLVVHGENGWFVDRDARDVARRLELLVDADLRERLARRSRTAASAFERDRAAAAYLEVYGRALEGRR